MSNMMGVRNKIKQVALLRIMSESLVKKRKITNLKKRAMKMNMMKSRKAKAKMSMMLKNSKITMMKN